MCFSLWNILGLRFGRLEILFLSRVFAYLGYGISYKIWTFWFFFVLFYQVKAGSVFDNILVCDDPEYARKVAQETWGQNKEVQQCHKKFYVSSCTFEFPWLYFYSHLLSHRQKRRHLQRHKSLFKHKRQRHDLESRLCN